MVEVCLRPKTWESQRQTIREIQWASDLEPKTTNTSPRIMQIRWRNANFRASFAKRLFVAQGLDGIELGGFDRRKKTGKDSHNTTEGHGYEHRFAGDLR